MSVGHKSSRKHVCFIRLCDFKMTSLVCSCKVLISRLPVAANRCERRTEALRSDAPKRSDVKCFLSLPNMEKDFFPPTAPVTYEVNPPPPPSVSITVPAFPPCPLRPPAKPQGQFSPPTAPVTYEVLPPLPPSVASSCSLLPSCHLSAPSKHTDIFSPASESRWKSVDLAGARRSGRLCLPGCNWGLFVLARG